MTLYGFYYNSCVHESADALVSLHKSEANALIAKHNHYTNHLNTWGEEYDWQVWSVKEVEVEE